MAVKQTAEEEARWHWRDSMRPARFFGLDARAGVPYFFLIFSGGFFVKMLIFTFFVTMIFRLMEKKGYTFPAALRALRLWLSGSDRNGWVSLRYRKMIDYG